jgi:hypothetical protein
VNNTGMGLASHIESMKPCMYPLRAVNYKTRSSREKSPIPNISIKNLRYILMPIDIKYIDRSSLGEVQVNLAQLYVATCSCWRTHIKSNLSSEKVLPNAHFMSFLGFY